MYLSVTAYVASPTACFTCIEAQGMNSGTFVHWASKVNKNPIRYCSSFNFESATFLVPYIRGQVKVEASFTDVLLAGDENDMDWLQHKFESSADIPVVSFREFQKSRILAILKKTNGTTLVQCWELANQNDWDAWLDADHFQRDNDVQSRLYLLLCGRTKKSYPDPMIVSNLPFSKSVFNRLRSVFHIHGSIFRIINRNTNCAFVNASSCSEATLVYNCRTASTWPQDMALSVTVCPQTSTTWAVAYGCDEKAFDFFSTQLIRSDHQVFHPMTLPTLFADWERNRQIEILRANVNKMLQRFYDLTVNRSQLEEHDTLSDSLKKHMYGEHSVLLWVDMSYLRNGLQNWQRQLQKMIEHTDKLAVDVYSWKSSKSFFSSGIDSATEIDSRVAVEMRGGGARIRERLQELVDEYEEHIRECSTVIEGLVTATSVEIKHSSQQISNTNLEVSKMAQKDGSVMKSIALLTMVFLPATFVSTFFSMDFFDWPHDQLSPASPFIWIYVVVAVMLTLLTVGLFLTCTTRMARSNERVADEGL